tara:strand:- start:485 stop:892 length:408 start_codon:yes stop_codon:yes gene_type:complete
MKFIKNHGGRENYFPTKLKKDLTSDCVIRAIAIATETDYKEVMTKLFEIGLEVGQMPNNKKCYEIYLNCLGWIKKSPLKIGRRKYKVKNVGKFFTGKNVIIHTTRHLTTLVDGNLNDTWDCREWCANSYYIKENK